MSPCPVSRQQAHLPIVMVCVEWDESRMGAASLRNDVDLARCDAGVLGGISTDDGLARRVDADSRSGGVVVLPDQVDPRCGIGNELPFTLGRFGECWIDALGC